MIYIQIWGGIGNQMFQMAAAQALATKHQTTIGVCLERIKSMNSNEKFTKRNFELDKIFDLSDIEIIDSNEFNYYLRQDLPIAQKLKRKLQKYGVLIEKNLSLDPSFFNLPSTAILDGYFQSERYFIDYEDQIRQRFEFDATRLNTKSREFRENFPKKSIAVHVRRGDFVQKEAINKVHGTCSVEYYQKAIDHLTDGTEQHVIVFSDDPQWVKQNLKFDLTTFYIDWNTGGDAWQDMYLMSKCDNFVIANSTFSWWGAWLSQNNNKTVIAPEFWFADEEKNSQTKDLIPPSWMKMS